MSAAYGPPGCEATEATDDLEATEAIAYGQPGP